MDYYLGGKATQEKLSRKFFEIKNTNFTWLYLSAFRNTRSYAKVLEKLFSSPLLVKEIRDKFNAEYIEIVNYYKDR